MSIIHDKEHKSKTQQNIEINNKYHHFKNLVSAKHIVDDTNHRKKQRGIIAKRLMQKLKEK